MSLTKEFIKEGFDFAIYMTTLPFYLTLVFLHLLISIFKDIISKVLLYLETGSVDPAIVLTPSSKDIDSQGKSHAVVNSTPAVAPGKQTVDS